MSERVPQGASEGLAGAPVHLRIERLGKRFGDAWAVREVSLDIGEREIFALLGSSGCGKSTLLRMIAGLETPSSGRILLDGEDPAAVPAHRRPTNMMFQSYALFPHMTVADNVAFGLRQLRPRMARAAIAARVDEMLELVQMRAFARRRPQELSGGQQQRVALARSLAREPRLLLLDEPLAALDKRIRQQTQFELVGLIRRVGVTCILVTHDQEEAMTMADRIGILSEGGLVQVGTPGEIYERPNCRFSAGFIGETNLFHGRIEGDRLASSDFPQPIVFAAGAGASPPSGGEAWLSLRPECVRVHRRAAGDACVAEHPGENVAAAEVAEIAYLGGRSIY
ncbi:MAG TPA: ABC transporter ATP-binding protein, partial [Thauera sp.]|uniref:ABC transporter ATP-binding protein n=1 Tax=Thauera sp. TaxID=1905334 RepID=UPI002C8FB212